MSKITMPEPSAWMLACQTMTGDICWKLSWSRSGAGQCNRLSGESNEQALITTAQAEAYASARIQELLHEKSKPDNIKRAEYYGEGYADGFAAGLDRAKKAIDEILSKTTKPTLPDEAMAGEQELD